MEEDIVHYCAIIKDYIYKNYKLHFHKPIEGKIRFPYFSSGIDYTNQVWDWGSWLASISMRSIEDKDLEKCQKGIIFNFLDTMNEEGRMPILFSSVPAPWLHDDSNAFKPVFAQHILEISTKYNDFTWISKDYEKIKRFISYYEKYQKDNESGLFYWLDDVSIGTDNDPTVFYRPRESSAAIYLNSLMYKELLAVSKIAKGLSHFDDEKIYLEKAESLKEAIRRECYDPIDGYYYSADITLRKIDENEWLHSGQRRFWKTLPMKITTWAGMLPLWANIASEEEAKRCVERYLNKEGLFSEFGIRSLAKNEKMYCESDNCNPSCWLGPVWINANYFTFLGLKNYGFDKLAYDMAVKTIRLLGKDLENNGGFHEYYNSLTGEGIRGLGMHGWNFLALEFIKYLENEKDPR